MQKPNFVFLLATTLLVSCGGGEQPRIDLSHEKVVVFKPQSIDGLVQLPDGAVFKGGYKNGLFNGKGQLVWSNGDRYQGEFKNGLKNGVGKEVLASGVTYEGKYVNGYWQGKGKVKFKNGGSYEGDFKQNAFNGVGKYVSYDGIVYEGEFKNDRMDGKGTIHYPKGASYEGEVKDWKMHGAGVYTTSDKAVTYSGEFINNALNGKGRIKYKNGVTYTGDIKNWRADGVGKIVSKDGVSYTGEFKNNLYEGKGVLVYKNGNRYEGEFKEGLRQGHGKYVMANPKGRKKELVGWWEYDSYYGEKEPKRDKDGNVLETKKENKPPLDAEKLFYAQHDLLNASLAKVLPERPNLTDMYFLGFAGYGDQDVFMKEVLFAKKMFDKTFQTTGRSFVLVNNRKSIETEPLATVTNLEITLQQLAKVMDPEKDILFIYLTSHGSEKYGLSVSLAGLPFNDLSAAKFAQILKNSKIKWKVIAISSCYSGEFIDALKDEHTLVMTSARADHVSFGCSDEADFTYFGEALLKDSIPTTNSFVSAFKKTRELVMTRENKEKYDHSEPQLWTAPAIEKQLLNWRRSLVKTAMLAR